jgi:hypothetical protein
LLICPTLELRQREAVTACEDTIKLQFIEEARAFGESLFEKKLRKNFQYFWGALVVKQDFSLLRS